MAITHPSATLIASSSLHMENMENLMDVQPESTDAETLIVLGGRICYQSLDRPNAATRNDGDYLRSTIFDKGHTSIAQHATASIYLQGVSRAFTHELIRHKHFSFSQVSQRFVNSEAADYIIPPAITDTSTQEALKALFDSTSHAYGVIVQSLRTEGKPLKQAREAARAILPNATETRILVTGNFLAWGEMLTRRAAPDADAEFQQVAGLLLDVLEPLSPVYFGHVRAQITANLEG